MTPHPEVFIRSTLHPCAVETPSAGSRQLAVTLDLSKVGLYDILGFRARHWSEFCAYVLALEALGPGPTSPAIADRRAALVDKADRLRELQRRHWTKLGPPTSLGIVGAA